MKKENRFNIGDKVFAKVKGYPYWPAIVLEDNGKKYKVKFYGTGEIGQIKFEDMSYYTKSKHKFVKLKRKDFIDSVQEIEEAIKVSGTDGSPDYEANENGESISNDSMPITTNSAIPKKRKRSSSISKKTDDNLVIKSKKAKLAYSGNVRNLSETHSFKIEGENGTHVDEKSIKKHIVASENEKKTEHNSSNSDDKKEQDVCDKLEAVETTGSNKTLEAKSNSPIKGANEGINVETIKTLSLKDYTSEKELEAYIAFGEYVEKHKEKYTNLPVEERYDAELQNFPFFFDGKCIGIKLHSEWPLKTFSNEYDRATYDRHISQNALEKRKTFKHDHLKMSSNFIENLKLSEDEVNTMFNQKLIEMKKKILEKLKIEGTMLQIDLKIKSCLSLQSAEPEKAIALLEEMLALNLSAIMLKKHANVVDMVRRLKNYVGNMESWDFSEEEKKVFRKHAEIVRNTALKVYVKFMQIVGKPPGVDTFWDAFNTIVTEFREETKDLSEGEYYVLTCEPNSRENFLNNYFIKEMSLGIPFQNNTPNDSNVENKLQRSEVSE